MNSPASLLPSPPGRGAGGEGPRDKIALPPELLTFARELRVAQTDPESLLWYLLRDRRFLGCKFRRQHPVPPYVLDFYCRELQIAVELDGGQHNDPLALQRDERRSAVLQAKGIRVLRYWNHDVLNRLESVLEDLAAAVQHARSLTPDPSPGGRGEKEQ